MIGERYPDTYDECVMRLSAQLEQHATQTETLNAFLISALLDLFAEEAAPIIEQAFMAGHVDEEVQGDWEDVQIELRLKTHRDHPRKPTRLSKLGDRLQAIWGARAPDPVASPAPLPKPSHTPFVAATKVGRNEPCPCGSGKKSKKCCGR